MIVDPITQGTELANDEVAVGLIKLGEQCIADRDWVKAIDLYDLLLAKYPQNPHVRYSLATLYSEIGKYGLAISILEGVVRDVPQHAQAWNNLGIAYKNAARLDKAKAAYDKALELNYNAIALVNMSGLFVNANAPREAQMWAEKGLHLDPSNAQLLNHRALALLEQGRWQEGFEAYDSRFGIPNWSGRKYADKAPLWNGEKVDHLLIHGEQGLGDEIMFLSALDRARPYARRITLECAVRLTPILERSFRLPCFGTEQEIWDHKVDFDAWYPMGSLFRFPGPEPGGALQYLRTGSVYQKTPKFRLGLSWRGGTVQTHEHLRNFDLRWWRPLTDPALGEVISLQYGPAGGMAKALEIRHDQQHIDNLDKLLSMIASCNLVVSVCNTAVHMAGALGVPCWVLVPDAAAWRYINNDGERMLWYKTVRLVRQRGRPWEQVVRDTRAEIKEKFGI